MSCNFHMNVQRKVTETVKGGWSPIGQIGERRTDAANW